MTAASANGGNQPVGSVSVTVSVNGRRRVIDCRPGDTLLEALRGHLNLTGTKSGCEIGYCGACTVLIDGAAAHSCCLLAATMDGREVTTIEGIGVHREAAGEGRGNAPAEGRKSAVGGRENTERAGDEGLDPVQVAFLETGAVQCGYCTPGFVVAVKALLAENPAPSEAEIRRYLTGNICRCSGFAAIVRAVATAAAGEVR